VELAKEEMVVLGLCKREEIVGGTVVRQEKAYPIYDDTYHENVRLVREELETRYASLHLVGRNGMHRYNNQDHAMMTAMLTVRNIVAGKRLYNIWQVNEDAEYHETGSEGQLSADQQAALSGLRDVPCQLPRPA
jgi:protoporphyrinogen oxidase